MAVQPAGEQVDRKALEALAIQYGLSPADLTGESREMLMATGKSPSDAELRERVRARIQNLYPNRGSRSDVATWLDGVFGPDRWGMYEVPDEALLLIVVPDDTECRLVAQAYDDLPNVLPVGVVFRVVVKPARQRAAVAAAERMGGNAAAVCVLKELED
jgi:hypothetical protein